MISKKKNTREHKKDSSVTSIIQTIEFSTCIQNSQLIDSDYTDCCTNHTLLNIAYIVKNKCARTTPANTHSKRKSMNVCIDCL